MGGAVIGAGGGKGLEQNKTTAKCIGLIQYIPLLRHVGFNALESTYF